MSSFLEGQVAIVTGSGRGIGRAEAMALAAAGARVVVNDLGSALEGEEGEKGSLTPAQETVAEIRRLGGEAVANGDSVASYEGAARIIQQAMDSFGQLDILVNNAGNLRIGMIEEHSEADFDQVIAVHLKGTFNSCRHAVPVMKKNKHGRIINTASNQWRAPSGQLAYAAAKGGIVSLTWELAFELDKHGVTANAIAPFASTRMTLHHEARNQSLRASGEISERRLASFEPRTEPSMVPPMVVYLASKHAAQVNGCVFRVGGDKIGRFAHPEEQATVFHDIEEGPWNLEQLVRILPQTLFARGSKAPHI